MSNLAHAAEHVQDAYVFRVPGFLGALLPDSWHVMTEAGAVEDPGLLWCPQLPIPVGFDLSSGIEWTLFPLSKYMILELVAAVVILAIFLPLAWRMSRGGPPKGRFWNCFEVFLLFIRDKIARPAIGGRAADKYLPFLWTMFCFVLCCNLLGLVPWMGSPTGAIGTTGALAGITLIAVFCAGIQKHGVVQYVVGLVPRMDVPLPAKILLWPMLFLIELLGLLIKHFVLAIRLLANMFAGHLVMAVIIGFVAATADSPFSLWLAATGGSVLGSVALSLLELFVAFLQAYIFVFLSALFIGMAVHQH